MRNCYLKERAQARDSEVKKCDIVYCNFQLIIQLKILNVKVRNVVLDIPFQIIQISFILKLLLIYCISSSADLNYFTTVKISFYTLKTLSLLNRRLQQIIEYTGSVGV